MSVFVHLKIMKTVLIEETVDFGIVALFFLVYIQTNLINECIYTKL